MELLVQRCRIYGFGSCGSSTGLTVLDDQIPWLGLESDLLGILDIGKYRDGQNLRRGE